MSNPIMPHLSQAEQASLYDKLNQYNEGKASFKEAGAYLVVIPRPDNPQYSLWIYDPLAERQSIFYIRNLSEDVHEALRMASTLLYYSPRRLLLVEYNAKHMQSRGDDIISYGKYRGHFLHEILMIDPSYLTWIAFKFTPRISKQERFVQIAKIYHSVHLDMQQRRSNNNHFLGKEGEKLENLTLTVVSVQLEDDPYKTTLRGITPFFYVRQVLTMKNAAGQLATLRINAHTASRHSAQLPAMEHAYQVGDTVQITSARITRTYTVGYTSYTRLAYAKLKHE